MTQGVPMYSEELVDEICERLMQGDNLTTLCARRAMPHIKTLQRWRAKDAELDERIWTAHAAGLQVRIEKALAGLENAKSSVEVQKGRELLHHLSRQQSKLVARFADKLKVDETKTIYHVRWEGEEDPAAQLDVATLPEEHQGNGRDATAPSEH